MEDMLRSIYQEKASQINTLGILKVNKKYKVHTLTDMFDVILLIIVKEQEEQQPITMKHYIYEDEKAALHIIEEAQLEKWILLGTNRKIIEWIDEGEILFDRNDYMEKLRVELRDFPFYGRKIKMGLEFAKLIRRYFDGKAFFENGHYLDAYNHIVHSLHHLGRLSLIENGFHPELTVWDQVKRIEPEIFKLYEELVKSDESLEKRLELLFLAGEFLINDRATIGSAHLLEVLESKEFWSIEEITLHKETKYYGVDLSIMLEYLIDKDFIQIIEMPVDSHGLHERLYRRKEKEK